MSNNTIISTGNTYRIYDSAVQTHDRLPVATYRVRFSPIEGFSLQRVDSITVGGERIYGSHFERLRRIKSTYGRMQRSLGVLMSGDKGMGKSLMVRLIGEQLSESERLPVILVDADAPGISDFLDTLGESIIVFDEFEKVFPEDSEAGNRQTQFLSLFDGLSVTKRMYVVTVNEVNRLSNYFVNRTGRFHYHIRFDYPDTQQVREYLNDMAPNAAESEVDAAVAFALKTNINFDHLRSIAFELDAGEKFSSIITDLNIKKMQNRLNYSVSAFFRDGTVITDREPLDFFAEPGSMESVDLYSSGRHFTGVFPVDSVMQTTTGLEVQGSSVEVGNDPEYPSNGELIRIEFKLAGQQSFAY